MVRCFVFRNTEHSCQESLRLSQQLRGQGATPEHRQHAKSEQRIVERAKIILKCLDGVPLEDIAKQVDVSKVTVSKCGKAAF